jgi:molybdate transport system regulatory protein
VLDLGEGKTITATITSESGESLTFAPGERAQAIVKASHVILAVDWSAPRLWFSGRGGRPP